MSYKVIDKRIADDAKARKTSDAFTQETMNMIAAHAAGIGKGDVSRVAKLLNALPASMRRATVSAWFTRYTPVVIEGGKGGKPFTCSLSDKYKALAIADKPAAWKLADGKANPFYVIADNEPETKELTLAALLKMIGGLAKRVEDKASEGKVAANDVATIKAKVQALREIAA